MIFKLLLKQAEMVVQTDSVTCQSECCDRIKETCRKTSESAVSERRLRLCLFDLADVLSVLLQHLFYFLINTEIDHVVREQFSDQELC